jgi:hypothetical protein
MQKTIEQILQLSKNPHYTLTQEEVARLQAYLNEQTARPRKNKNVVEKHTSKVTKHNTKIEE